MKLGPSAFSVQLDAPAPAAFGCHMKATDVVAKFTEAGGGGTYLHRKCGRAENKGKTIAITSSERSDARNRHIEMIGERGRLG
jgi:hypothetical protein